MTSSLNIAVADDEPDVLEFYAVVLPELGHRVICMAGNGRELVRQCLEYPPDLLVIDVKMPQLDGIEAIQQLSQRGPIPAIVVSGYCDRETIQRAEEEYILAYLIKPVRETDLEAAITIAMRRYEEFEELRSETPSLPQARTNRKTIVQATRALMELGLEEEQAFERLQQLARKEGCPLVEIAAKIAVVEEAPA